METIIYVSYEERQIAKNAGCRWKPTTKQWVFIGDELPEALKTYAIKPARKPDPRDGSNLCPRTDDNSWECECSGCRAWRNS